jgi:hypothetical protein
VTDLDGDGALDVYCGLASSGIFTSDDGDPRSSYALMGNGDGTFQGAQKLSPGTFTGTNLADLNGDGYRDLLVGYATAGSPYTFQVQRGGAKGFTPGASFGIPDAITVNGTNLTGASRNVTSFAVGDINGDGKPDLAFLQNGLTVQNSDGSASPYPLPVYSTSLGNGDGTFAAPVARQPSTAALGGGIPDATVTVDSLWMADVDRDGRNDLVMAYSFAAGPTVPIPTPYTNGVLVLPGRGDGTFGDPVLTGLYAGTTPTAVLPAIVSTADLNGDGHADLTVRSSAADGTSQFEALIAQQDETFRILPVAATGNAYGWPAVADLDGDGRPDMAFLTETASGDAALNVARGNGDGSFAPVTALGLPGGDAIRSGTVAAADFDADGKIDLALTAPLINGVALGGVFFGQGNLVFTGVPSGSAVYPKDLLNLQVGGSAAIATDLNGDGKPDLLAGPDVLLNTYGVVDTTPVTVSLAASASTVVQGTTVTFTATVAQVPASTIPAGTVSFVEGTTVLSTQSLDGTGRAQFPTASLTVGVHTITAIYKDTSGSAGVTSRPVTVIVTSAAGAATTVRLLTSANSVTQGTAVTFSAAVRAASGSATPSGNVTFLDGTTPLSTTALDTTGNVQISTSSLIVGTHTITAVYTGSSSFSGATSNPVTVLVTAPGAAVGTTTTLSPSATNVVQGTSVTFSSVVRAAAGTAAPPGSVSFLDGTTVLGTAALTTSGAAQFSTSSLAVGTHTITAFYGGNGSFNSSTSPPVTIIVTAPVQPTFTLTLSPVAATVIPGDAPSTTATIQSLAGFSAVVSLSCSGAPAHSKCTVSPASVTPAANGSVTAKVTLITNVETSTVQVAAKSSSKPFLAIIPVGALMLLLVRRRRGWIPALMAVLVLALSVGAVTGCGGDKFTAFATSTPAGVYPLTVTASSGPLTQRATFTVTVQ